MHKPYSEYHGHPSDFRVKYTFYPFEQGGRKALPIQGLRCDFMYDDDKDIEKNVAFMVWPEFEDANGDIILDKTKSVAQSGTARMMIMRNERREYHRGRIEIGVKCYFFEGGRTAECEIIEILGLFDNPIV